MVGHAETPGALACAINGVRPRNQAGAEAQCDYWISDGLYGSFNCVVYDAAKPVGPLCAALGWGRCTWRRGELCMFCQCLLAARSGAACSKHCTAGMAGAVSSADQNCTCRCRNRCAARCCQQPAQRSSSCAAAPCLGPRAMAQTLSHEARCYRAMRHGDFLLFPKLSAYSLAGACNFNGFDVMGARIFYYYPKD